MSEATTTSSRRPGQRVVVRRWQAVTWLLAAGVFSQAVLAGVLLSAVSWGRAAHEAVAHGLVMATMLAALAAVITLGRTSSGRRLAGALLALGVVLVIQTGLGILGSEGATTMWVHVPLGVALVGLSLRPVRLARQLTDPRPD